LLSKLFEPKKKAFENLKKTKKMELFFGAKTILTRIFTGNKQTQEQKVHITDL
jgi:hypothetical protein